MRSDGPMRRFVSPPLPPGHYTYTIKAIIPGPNGPRTVTRRIDVRPGDFESIDLREPGKRPITDVEYEPTPQKVVDALLRLAKVTSKDVVWDLGCGDGRIPVTAAKEYACKACGFDIDPERVKDSLANVRKHGVERLVTIEQRDIFTLDLSKGPTIVTLYLLPRLNARLLPQLRKLPPARAVISVCAPDGRRQAGRAHRGRDRAGRFRRLSVEGGNAPWQLTFHVLSSARSSPKSVRRLILADRMSPRPDDTEVD